MLNPNRVGMPFSRFGVKCMIARPDSLVLDEMLDSKICSSFFVFAPGLTQVK
mgnify:CR=1 FL=1